MKVKITGCTSPISYARMWYENNIGDVFEVVEDNNYSSMYITIEPIYKEHCGHINKIDCILVKEFQSNLLEEAKHG